MHAGNRRVVAWPATGDPSPEPTDAVARLPLLAVVVDPNPADLEIPALVVSRRMPRRSQLTVGDDEEEDDDEEDGDDEEDDGEGQGCKR